MNPPSLKTLASITLFAAACSSANADLKLNGSFTTSDTADFPDCIPIADAPNAATVEASINAALAQIDNLVATPDAFRIRFLDDKDVNDLGSSVTAGPDDISYTKYLAYLKAETGKTADFNTALASLPAGPGTGINNNASLVSLNGANCYGIGDAAEGKSLILANGGYAGTIALDLSSMNISRKTNNPNDYDLESVVMHEVDEILGVGGDGSTIGDGTHDVGPMDLFRYSASGVRSYKTSGNVASYFSINSGKTDLVHFNQSVDGDYGDWGDGVIPADDENNTPPQVQDAFGDPGTQTNMGRNEAIALNVDGWKLTTAGVSLEGAAVPGAETATPGGITAQAVPEPGAWASLVLGGVALIGFRRRRKAG